MNEDPNMRTMVTRSLLIVFTVVLMSASSQGQQSVSALYSKGYFDEIAEIGPTQINKLVKAGKIVAASQTAEQTCRSYIQLGKFDEAIKLVDSIADDQNLKKLAPGKSASLYFCKAAAFRSKHDYHKSFEILDRAISFSPKDPETKAGYHLEIGRTLYSSGHDFAAIVWLERAEREALAIAKLSIYFDSLRFLSLAWSAKSFYANAIAYANKLVEKTSIGGFEHRNRIALLELAGLFDTTGQDYRATAAYKKGLELSSQAKVNYHTGQYLSALFHRDLYAAKVDTAEKFLRRLELMDTKKQFTYECLLGNALVAHYRGNRALSDQLFDKLKNEEATTEFIVPYWKSTIAERDRNWKDLIEQEQILLKLTQESHFEDDLPGIYYKLAFGSWRLGDEKKARAYALKSLETFEPFRNESDVSLSIAMMENHHSLYRLLSEMELGANPQKAFHYSELLKSRVLSDRIERSPLKPRKDIPKVARDRLFELSADHIAGKTNEESLSNFEKEIVASKDIEIREQETLNPERLNIPNDTSVVSYEFLSNGDLIAYIIEANQPVRFVRHQLNETQVEALARETQSKIKDRIFFKKDGKELYEKLLRPLNLTTSEWIFVPDKFLWRIPFQALSPDGVKYLIETKTISYSPSVGLLSKLLESNRPIRKTIQIYANDTFNNQKLEHVNSEASNVARMFDTFPHVSASKKLFLTTSPQADILHFSMHAQLDGEDPLSSFLAFRQNAGDKGSLSVSDLLSLRLKPNNLAFVASCDTSRVLNGEGLVSIPWALLGSGSSTVISSQWEAADNSTRILVEEFYSNYLNGESTAKSLQKAAVSLINKKDAGFHEPYFWASVNLMGDFR